MAADGPATAEEREVVVPNPRYFGFDKKLPLRPSVNPSFKRNFRIRGRPVGFRITAEEANEHKTKPVDMEEVYAARNKYFEVKNIEYVDEYWGNPLPPGSIMPIVEQMRKERPEKAPSDEDLTCDVIYVKSDGTVMEIKTDVMPYNNEAGPSRLRKDERVGDAAEPRWVVQTSPGYAKQKGLEVGKLWDEFGEEARVNDWDNHYRQPKRIRPPLELPNGKLVQ
ncbi:unnamed protein product [Vitrella brassicaformis CCMP3155]|uniref:Uncharacterized protein n=2 Tax=Vitrella brassicaformis TaxID=1169539 RepID=A0A0G4G7T8_VITBC|nr:unnamed protein product [Vitrella brassicaformis CCMP3155]|eukprot:CEM24776.1 unnamed protein product [Vitrella brassicaformis CCMP3155]